ncbi:MAG: carbon-nitrogen hydrolase family protein [Planctomycetota bacterium]
MKTLPAFKVAAVQLRCTEDIDANVKRAFAGIREAAKRGARLIVLPERFLYPVEGPLLRRSAQSIPGRFTDRLSVLARELHVVLVAGSLLERIPGSRKFHNTALVFNETGRLIAKYRKLHLFRLDTSETGAISEQRFLVAGRRHVVADTSCGRIGLSICYDLRFPELYRLLAYRRTRVLVVPSAFQRLTGRAHWMTLLRARAIENQCYLVAADLCGSVAGRSFHGHSAIIDPWGEVLARAASRPEAIVAEISEDRLREVRRVLPSLADSVRTAGRAR